MQLDKDLKSRVLARVVANVDGWMNECMNGWKTRSQYLRMPETGSTKNTCLQMTPAFEINSSK